MIMAMTIIEPTASNAATAAIAVNVTNANPRAVVAIPRVRA